MEFEMGMLLLCSLILIIYFNFSGLNYRKKRKLPPGPFPLPIIGNILQVGRNPHRSAAKLSQTYGPLMHLRLGSVETIVVSSPEMAKQILQKHDQIFSARVVPCVIRELGEHEGSIVWMNPGPKWRSLRRICKEELFANSKLQQTKSLRQQKLHQLRHYLEDRCSTATSVNVDDLAFVTAINFLSETLFSLDFGRLGSHSAQQTTAIVRDVMQIASTPNIADFVPLLKPIDPQRLKRTTALRFAKLHAKLDQIVHQRLQSPSPTNKDLLQLLIDLHQRKDSDLSLRDINLLFLELIVAGTNTTSDTVQWAMTELVRNPEKMWRAKDEVRGVVGEKEEVEESDIAKLPYLGAVIKETLRCHPPGPFLSHKAQAEVEISGYTVPKDALILVNVWAIGRDSSIWSNPESFEPERFLDRRIDYKGQDFEFLPFGSGRRMCAGMPLADVMVHLMVASMIHNFDWELEAGMKPEDVDLNDEFGISLHKAVPLKLFPLRRHSN